MKKRRISALFILLIGVGYFLYTIAFKNGGGEIGSVIQSLVSGNKNDPSLSFEAALLRNPATAGPATAGLANTNQASNNFTDLLAQTYAAKIFNENPNAQTEGGIKKSSLDSLGDLLNGNFSKKIDYSVYSEKDIRISTDASKEFKIIYIKTVVSILQNHIVAFGETVPAAFSDFLVKKNPAPLNRIIENIPSLISDLLALQIPPNFSSIHLELLNAWQKKLVYYQAIVNFQTDPLKAYLVLNELKNMSETDANLYSFLSEQYQSLKS
ncbi:MAG: hypothetical protein AAB432_01065 [Patescibacteria group bacterium]